MLRVVYRRLRAPSDRLLSGFIAGKRSMKFRFLEAASRHRVLRARCSHCLYQKAAAQERPASGAAVDGRLHAIVSLQSAGH